MVEEDGTLWVEIYKTAFMAFCTEYGLHEKGVLTAWSATGLLKHDQNRLTKQRWVADTGARIRLYMISLNEGSDTEAA